MFDNDEAGARSAESPLAAFRAMPRRAIGLLGGTFDPIHYGHLRLAEEMADALGLDRVHILPTGTPPHRGRPRASAVDRLAMTRLAIDGNPRFRLDEHEVHKTVPCYMVDTLTELRAELGDALPIVLLLGADAFAGLESWHQWRRLLALCHIAVAERPGYELGAGLSPALAGVLATRLTGAADALSASPAGRVFKLAISRLEISASRVRDLVAEGRSARYLIPDGVRDYIAQHRLYR